MPDADDTPSSAMEPASVPATALRRCPGCHNQVTTLTPLCPVCGTHATIARVGSAVRWTVIAAGSAAAGWWWFHH